MTLQDKDDNEDDNADEYDDQGGQDGSPSQEEPLPPAFVWPLAPDHMIIIITLML